MTQSRNYKSPQATIVATKVHHCHLLPTIMHCDHALCHIFDFGQCSPTLANHMLQRRARYLKGGGKVGIRRRRRVAVEPASIVRNPRKGTLGGRGSIIVAHGTATCRGSGRFGGPFSISFEGRRWGKVARGFRRALGTRGSGSEFGHLEKGPKGCPPSQKLRQENCDCAAVTDPIDTNRDFKDVPENKASVAEINLSTEDLAPKIMAIESGLLGRKLRGDGAAGTEKGCVCVCV